MTKPTSEMPAEPTTFYAADGYRLAGHCWTAQDTHAPVVVINAATSVRSAYYARFAAYLHLHGFHVITYDYRGIGRSRQGSLKPIKAGWLDWGELDFEAAIGLAKQTFTNSDIYAVGHSVGGLLVGLAPSNHSLSRVFTMGAQHAYWPDYMASSRWQMRLRWHVVMPAITALLGYFPGKRLGWLEDTPAGVVRDWVAPYADFFETYRSRHGSHQLTPEQVHVLRSRFTAMTAPTLALGITDDPFGTPAAIDRLLAYFTHSPSTHRRLAPADVGASAVGHFGFFHSRFQDKLWPVALEWLQQGRNSH